MRDLKNTLLILLLITLYIPIGFSEALGGEKHNSSVSQEQDIQDRENITTILAQVLHPKNFLIPNVLLPVQDSNPDVTIRSQDQYIPKYEAGQGGVSLGLGVLFPLFFQKFTGEYITDTNLSVGGSIWFEWDIFLWKGLSAGMEIAGMFAITPNTRALFVAPITGHIKYTFQVFPIEFPVSFAMGISMSSLEEHFKADFVLKPKGGITYRINQNWSTGLFLSYWFVVQSYDYTLGAQFSRLGNFMDLSAGVSYVF